jgi:proton-translocating NADH-quinone oxidoreductase chain L
MYLLPIYFTLISFLISFFFGRLSNNYYVGFFTSILVLLSFIISIFLFYEVALCHAPTYIYCGNWITTELLEIQWTFAFDSLTVTMLIVILSISTCAHFYSIEYMLYDPHQIKFMSYLSLFTFFMLLLVTSSNFIILFLGWEGVGISSYLLINFWHTRVAANKSAIMAMFVNKIGDISLLIAFSLLFFIFYTFDFSILFLAIQSTMYDELADFNKNNTWLLYIICFFFIIGAVGKSAQLGLHTWLPEAMEGPTPVSSLIHAATMVTAGIFLVIRSNIFFQWCNDIFIIIVAFGSLTAFVGSTIGVFQSDIKKIIAYSTCSQLGYMFLACGLNGYYFSIYHLTNHAFFKALLFLVAGYIIHAINNEQDIRQLGGLLYVLPFAYIGLMIGSLSLLGFPFFSGFFSKEKIIELFYSFFINNINNIIYINILYFFQLLASISVTFTVLYSIKVLINVFYYTFQNHSNKLINLHYSSIITILPLFFLSILSIISGYFLEDMMVNISSNFWNFSILFQPTYEIFNLNEFEFNLLSSKLPILSIIFFLALFFIFYYYFENSLYYLKINFIETEMIYQFFNKKYMILNKNIYYPLIDFFFKFSYNSMYTLFDKGIIETFGPFGITKIINQSILKNNKFQSGLIYHYFGMIILSFLIINILFFSILI